MVLNVPRLPFEPEPPILDDTPSHRRYYQIAGVTIEVLDGAPSLRLLDFDRSAAMLVVGSRGRGGFAGLLLGSVSQHLAEHARCPVVIVPACDDEAK